MHWYDWHTVTERLQGRSYALTRGRPYRVILDPATQTGTCDFTNKQILVNPNLFSDVMGNMGLSGPKLDEANFLVSRAITGHEALHVLYSDPKIVVEAMRESPAVKVVLNLLEDARIERIGSDSSHVSKTLFRFVNGIAKSQLPEFRDIGLKSPSSIINLLLRWRLGSGIPKLQRPADRVWDQVLALANTAVHCRDCAEVLAVAREIVKVAGLNQASEDPAVDPLIERMESSMTGERDSSPMPNPLPSADQTTPTDEIRADDSEADSAGIESAEEEQPEDLAEGSASGPSGVMEEDAPQSADDPSDRSDDEDNLGELVHSVNTEDIEKLIEETAQQVSEHLESLVPPETDSNSVVAKAKPHRGRCYSDIVATPYITYLPEVAPIAAEITRELRAEGPKAVSGPSESAGRFRARYYVRDSGRPFAAQKFQGLSVPKMALSLILDRSGSMEGIVEELKVMAMAISQACETLHVPSCGCSLPQRS